MTKPKVDINVLEKLLSQRNYEIEAMRKRETEIADAIALINTDSQTEIERLRVRVAELEEFTNFAIKLSETLHNGASAALGNPQTLRQL